MQQNCVGAKQGRGRYRPPPSYVLRSAANGIPASQIVRRLSELARSSAEDAEVAVANAFDLASAALRDERMAPPVQVHFLSAPLVPVASVDRASWRHASRTQMNVDELDDLRSEGIALLETYRAGTVPSALGDPATARRAVLAIRFAQTLLEQIEGLALLDEADNTSSSVHGLLAPEDRAIVRDVLLARLPVVLLDDSISTWARFVESLAARPQTWMFEEYTDQLARRDRLADVVSVVSPRSAQQLGPNIAAIDERFHAVTQHVAESIEPARPWTPQRWWWFRTPDKPGEPFLTMLAITAPTVASRLRQCLPTDR